MTGHNDSTYFYYVNSSDLPLYDDHAAYDMVINNQTHTAVFGIILTIWTLFMNTLVIVSNFCEAKTRFDVFYLQIVNLSAVNILIGLFAIPLTVYSLLFPWELGEVLCKMWIIIDVLLPFASMLILILMNIDRIILITHPKIYQCLFEKCLKHILLLTPWLISLITVVPLWTYGALPYELNPGECIIMITHSAALACTILTYFVPLLVIVCLILKLLITKMRNHQDSVTNSDQWSLKVSTEPSPSASTNMTPEQRRINNGTTNSVMALCLANFVLCTMWFPFQCVSVIMTLCTSHLCMPSSTLSQTVTWAATASSGIVPLVFLVDLRIKRGCSNALRCINHSDSDLDNGVQVWMQYYLWGANST